MASGSFRLTRRDYTIKIFKHKSQNCIIRALRSGFSALHGLNPLAFVNTLEMVCRPTVRNRCERGAI
jgi:hypothetical protein